MILSTAGLTVIVLLAVLLAVVAVIVLLFVVLVSRASVQKQSVPSLPQQPEGQFPATTAESPQIDIDWDGDWIEIGSLGFCGQYSKSSDGVFAVGWGGHYGDKPGSLGGYVLVRNNCIVLTGVAERPQDGKVANNGTFILNDWLWDGELSGTFLAFSATGERLISHQFEANLHNNGISPDGRFAVCYLCNSPHPDGGTLAFFNLEDRCRSHRSLLTPDGPSCMNSDFLNPYLDSTTPTAEPSTIPLRVSFWTVRSGSRQRLSTQAGRCCCGWRENGFLDLKH